MRGLLEDDIRMLKDEQRKGTNRKEEMLYMKKFLLLIFEKDKRFNFTL